MPAIPEKLPPIFLAWAQDDAVALGAVIKFYDSLKAAGYKPEAHIFSAGGHGFGMRKQGTTSDHWIDDSTTGWKLKDSRGPKQDND